MPSWSIHLAIAKKVSDKLKIDKDLFSFGSLIPDTDKDCKLGRYEAHYYNKRKEIIMIEELEKTLN